MKAPVPQEQALLQPSAFLERSRADQLADRLARSGINLVRLGDLDTPLGQGRSLFDDTRDDTKGLDPLALSKLDHLIATLKARGIYVALELQSARRFRRGDEVPGYRGLLPGGGPAAAFDPTIRRRALEAAEALLTHVNPETGLALRDDPVLAWITLAGELTLFDLIEDRDLLPPESEEVLRNLAHKTSSASMAGGSSSESSFAPALIGTSWLRRSASLRASLRTSRAIHVAAYGFSAPSDGSHPA